MSTNILVPFSLSNVQDQTLLTNLYNSLKRLERSTELRKEAEVKYFKHVEARYLSVQPTSTVTIETVEDDESEEANTMVDTTNFCELRVVDLRKECKKRHLPCSGTKMVLVERLSGNSPPKRVCLRSSVPTRESVLGKISNGSVTRGDLRSCSILTLKSIMSQFACALTGNKTILVNRIYSKLYAFGQIKVWSR